MSQNSSTERYLKGRTLQGHEKSPVSAVTKHGEKRTVVFENGQKVTLQPQAFDAAFQATMSRDQRVQMEKTRRVHADGTITQKMGGKKKGETRTYKTMRGAKGALTRTYGKQ